MPRPTPAAPFAPKPPRTLPNPSHPLWRPLLKAGVWAQWKVIQLLHTLREAAHGDPWRLLRPFGYRNWSPIPHTPDTSHPVETEEGTVYCIKGTKPSPKRKVITGEPIEDYELGRKVPPATTVPRNLHPIADEWGRRWP